MTVDAIDNDLKSFVKLKRESDIVSLWIRNKTAWLVMFSGHITLFIQMRRIITSFMPYKP